MAKRQIDKLTGEELVAYVEEQLGHPRYRTFNSIASDFAKRDGLRVTSTDLSRKLKKAIPGTMIVFKKVGVLVRHEAQKADIQVTE